MNLEIKQKKADKVSHRIEKERKKIDRVNWVISRLS